MSELDGDPIAEALALAERLPARAVAAVFRRYGKPLEEELAPVEPDDQQARLLLPDGTTATLRVLQVRLPVDVISNDWFILEAAGSESLAIAGPLFASALAALARSLERRD